MPRYRMFIDDTGDVDNPTTADPKRRYASITGVIIDLDYYHSSFSVDFEALKLAHFGLTNKGRTPILRRHNLMIREGPFAKLKDSEKNHAWETACFDFYSVQPYTVITSSVDKLAYYWKHQNDRQDMYHMLITNAVERYFFFLNNSNSTGDVMAEAMSDKHDKALKSRFRYIMENGSSHKSAHELNRVMTSKEIKIKPKSDNIAGLQVADLFAAVSFHHCHQIYGNGIGPKGFSQRVAQLLEQQKYYRNRKGNPHSYGRIWRPQN